MRVEWMFQEDHFNCFICLQSLNKTRLLPCCGKPACANCLKATIPEWFQQQTPTRMTRRVMCPHCRKEISITDPISCPLIDSLQDQFGQLVMQNETSGGKKCFKHGDTMKYYCINCDEAACSDGVAIYGLHRDHEIVGLGKVQQEYEIEVQEITTMASHSDAYLKEEFAQFIEEGKSKYVEEINGFVSEMERHLDSDIARLSSEYQGISKMATEKAADVKSEFNDLLSYYDVSVKDGRMVSKALRWTSDIKSRYQSLMGSVEEDRSRLSIPNHVTPPTWSFDLIPGVHCNVVLGQTFEVRVDQAHALISYKKPKAAFIVTVQDEFKEDQVGLGPGQCEARVELLFPQAKLMIRPASYKDAYEALSSTLL